MLGHRLVVLADAHLGAVPARVEERLLAFLDHVPGVGDCLLVNGDLFDFWFSYRRVVPRQGFRAAAALAQLARRMPVVMTGGNHDRWGDDFWERDVGVRYAAREVRFEVGDRRVLAVHGDGLTEPGWAARTVHRVIGHPATARLYRALHPDFGIALVERAAPHLGDGRTDAATLDRARERQQAWAAEALRDDATDLVVMGHTHCAAVAEPLPGRFYLNPGAWFDEYRYAVVTAGAIELRHFE